jgi:ribonucleotide reductase beta subunit family protein with ferritin-like domain
VLTDDEKQFYMSIVEFFIRFQAGQTDDSAESMKWASLERMAGAIRKRVALFSEISE